MDNSLRNSNSNFNVIQPNHPSLSPPLSIISHPLMISFSPLLSIGRSPLARYFHSATSVNANEEVIVCGGVGIRTFSDIFVLDTSNLHWSEVRLDSPLPAIYEHTASYVNNRIIVFGGRQSNKLSRTVHIIDIKHEKLTTFPKLKNVPKCRTAHSAVVIAGDHVLVFGGYGGHASYFSDVNVFVPPVLNWYKPKVRGVDPCKRAGHSAVIVGSKMIVFGGYNKSSFFNDVLVLDTCDGENMEWSRPAVLGIPPLQRGGHSAVMFRHYMIIFGGCGVKNVMFNDLCVLDCQKLVWIPLIISGATPTARFGHTAVMHRDNMLILNGSSPSGAIDGCILVNLKCLETNLNLNIVPNISVSQTQQFSYYVGRSQQPLGGSLHELDDDSSSILSGTYSNIDGMYSVFSNNIESFSNTGAFAEWEGKASVGEPGSSILRLPSGVLPSATLVNISPRAEDDSNKDDSWVANEDSRPSPRHNLVHKLDKLDSRSATVSFSIPATFSASAATPVASSPEVLLNSESWQPNSSSSVATTMAMPPLVSNSSSCPWNPEMHTLMEAQLANFTKEMGSMETYYRSQVVRLESQISTLRSEVVIKKNEVSCLQSRVVESENVIHNLQSIAGGTEKLIERDEFQSLQKEFASLWQKHQHLNGRDLTNLKDDEIASLEQTLSNGLTALETERNRRAKAQAERLASELSKLCHGCKKQGITSVFVPCGDMIMCHDCGSTVSICPLCGKDVLSCLRIRQVN